MKHLSGLRLETVATRVVVFLLHFSEPRKNAVHVSGLRRVAHGVLQRLELVVEIAKPSAPGDRLVQDRSSRHLLDILTKVTDGQLLRH